MEAHLTAIPSPTRLWWSALGKWQALMAGIILVVFFVTLSITGDKTTATITAVAFAATFVTITALATFAVSAFAATITALVATFAAFAVATTAFGVTVVLTVAFTITAAFAVATTKEIPGVGKKVAWSSYMGEFLLILLPMLWVLHG